MQPRAVIHYMNREAGINFYCHSCGSNLGRFVENFWVLQNLFIQFFIGDCNKMCLKPLQYKKKLMESSRNLFCLTDFLSERHDTLWQDCGETNPGISCTLESAGALLLFKGKDSPIMCGHKLRRLPFDPLQLRVCSWAGDTDCPDDVTHCSAVPPPLTFCHKRLPL